MKNFTKWLSEPQSIAFTLAIGILFLFTSYQNVIHITNPENSQDTFAYPQFLRIVISHLDSLFFALTTSIIMFQSKSESEKIVFCIFEGIMIFLNFNRNRLPEIFDISQEQSIFYLVCYLAVFSALSFYILGSLAKEHRQQAEPTQPIQAQATQQAEPTQPAQATQQAEPAQATQTDYSPTYIDDKLKYRDRFEKLNKIGFGFPPSKKSKAGRPKLSTEKEVKIIAGLENGKSKSQISSEVGVGKSTVTKVRNKQKQKQQLEII